MGRFETDRRRRTKTDGAGGEIGGPKLNIFNLNLLRVFDALYQERSATKAGDRLGLSQSTISHALSQLRYLLADELFTRAGSGMVPTERAIEIGDRVHRVLQDVRSIVSLDAFVPAQADKRFTIAASDYSSHVLLPFLVRRLWQEAPATRLRIVPLSADIVRGLDEGEIDLAIYTFDTIPDRMSCDALFDEATVLVARADHPQAGKEISDDELASIQIVAVDPFSSEEEEVHHGLLTRRGVSQWLATMEELVESDDPFPRRSERHRVVVPNYSVAMAIAGVSEMAALVPERLARELMVNHPLVKLSPRTALPKRNVMTLWHNDHGDRRDVRWLRTQLRLAAMDLTMADRSRWEGRVLGDP